jgi:hypothetical protein
MLQNKILFGFSDMHEENALFNVRQKQDNVIKLQFPKFSCFQPYSVGSYSMSLERDLCDWPLIHMKLQDIPAFYISLIDLVPMLPPSLPS